MSNYLPFFGSSYLCIIEHFGNADAVPQPPERCLSRQAGIVRCCLSKRSAPLPTI